MFKHFINNLCCPDCGKTLELKSEKQLDEEILEGNLICKFCPKNYLIKNGIPRFVPKENYANSFGKQWNLFPATQLDSKNGTKISHDRFFSETNWPNNLSGQNILEAGCGMGRFSEIALSTGANCYSLDYSTAVEATRKNIRNQHHCLVQADIYKIPFPKNFFDKIFCFGVLQHTPDVKKAFLSLVPYLKKGGEIVIDVYAAPINFFHPRQTLRLFTKYMDQDFIFNTVNYLTPFLLKISDLVAKIPKAGQVLRHAIPVANYKGRYPLSNKQIREWAILDTFDWLTPKYETPQFASAVKNWFKEANLTNFSIERNVGIYIARGEKS